jgi:hypothetical protein
LSVFYTVRWVRRGFTGGSDVLIAVDIGAMLHNEIWTGRTDATERGGCSTDNGEITGLAVICPGQETARAARHHDRAGSCVASSDAARAPHRRDARKHAAGDARG